MKKYEADGFKIAHSIDENPNDGDFQLHVHDDFELLCVVSGDVGYIVEGREYDLPHGSLMIMRRAEIHRLVVRSNERYERYVINFSSEILEKYGFNVNVLDAYLQRDLGTENQYLPSDFSGIDPLGLMRQAFASLEANPSEAVAVSYTAALLCAVNAAFYAKKESHAKAKDNFEQRIVAYINEHILDDISLADISEAMHISPSQLNRIFNRMTGVSVYNYILSKRLVYAQGMIIRGESAINACQECGFKDYSSFFRLYKKCFGVSPSASKKENLII